MDIKTKYIMYIMVVIIAILSIFAIIGILYTENANRQRSQLVVVASGKGSVDIRINEDLHSVSDNYVSYINVELGNEFYLEAYGGNFKAYCNDEKCTSIISTNPVYRDRVNYRYQKIYAIFQIPEVPNPPNPTYIAMTLTYEQYVTYTQDNTYPDLILENVTVKNTDNIGGYFTVKIDTDPACDSCGDFNIYIPAGSSYISELGSFHKGQAPIKYHVISLTYK